MPSAIISIPIVGSNKFNRPHAPATIIAKTIRAMADGTLDSQVGARICNGLGIMRACLETQKLEQLEARMGEISRLLGARTVVSSPLSIDHKTPLSINHETNGSSH
jgi:hypothetical protein